MQSIRFLMSDSERRVFREKVQRVSVGLVVEADIR